MSKAKGNKGNGSTYNKSKSSNRTRKDWDNLSKPEGTGYYANKPESSSSDDVRSSGRRTAQSKGTNHIEWYVPDNNMLQSVANIPFGYRTGDILPYMPGNPMAEGTWGYRMAGICRLNYIPTIGKASQPNDPVNVASAAVYSYIRKANSGARNYDHSDLMIYLLAMDAIYSGLSWLIRARGLAQTFNKMNTYVPKSLIESMGINHNELIRNLTSYTDQINTLILKATTLAVPSTFPLFVRHSYMNNNVYVDESNDRAQMYYFTPSYLHKFELDDEGRGMLSAARFAPADNTKSNFQTYINVVAGMLDNIYADEDVAIMSGDIIKAYGGNLIKLSTISNDYNIVPIYDHEMLLQIHNACFVPDNHTTGSLDITQMSWEDATGLAPVIVCEPKFEVPTYYDQVVGGDKILDLHCDVNAENVMRSTRLQFIGFTGDDNIFGISSCGSEILVKASLFVDPNDPDSHLANTYDGCLLFDAENYPISLNVITGAQSMSYFPVIYAYRPASEGEVAGVYPIANFDKTTVIARSSIQQLNNVALIGLWNIPRLSLG